MPERMQLKRKDAQSELKPKLTESEARRLLLLRLGIAFVALVVFIWVVARVIGGIGTARTAAQVYASLQRGVPRAEGLDAEIWTVGGALTRGQVRVLAAGGSLPYSRLTEEQQKLFAEVNPLPEPGAPPVEPYEIHLFDDGHGRRELQLVWTVSGTGEAVVKGIRL